MSSRFFGCHGGNGGTRAEFRAAANGEWRIAALVVAMLMAGFGAYFAVRQ